ncbi:ABC transporter permease [Fusibacter bizertensis]
MGAYIGFEFKRKFMSAKTFFIIMLILLLSFLKISDYNNRSILDDNSRLYTKAKEIEDRGKDGLYEYKRIFEGGIIDENIINSHKFMEHIGIEMQLALKDSDYKEYNRLSALGKILTAKQIAIAQNRLREMSLKKQVLTIWNELSEDMNYDDIYFENNGRKADGKYFYEFVAEAKHDYELYVKDLVLIDPYHIDSTTFIYTYMRDILPFIMMIIIIILSFDSINSEWTGGNQKMILTSIYSRHKYILSKVVVGIMYALSVILIPVVIISIGYGLSDGFNNYNYPVLYSKDNFSALTTIHNYVEFNLSNVGYNLRLGLSIFSGFPKGEMGMSNSLTLVPLFKFLLIGMVIVILYIAFYVILSTLISSMQKNKIISFVLLMLISLSGTFISLPLTLEDHINLSPFSMNNPMRILNGTYNTTAMSSIIILSGTSLVLLLFNLYYFKRKDI